MHLKLSKGKLRVVSSVCANLFSAFFLGLFVAKDLKTLTLNFVGAILALGLALEAEDLLERYGV